MATQLRDREFDFFVHDMSLIDIVSEAVDELFFDGVPGVAVFEEDCESGKFRDVFRDR